MRAVEQANPDTLHGIFGDVSWTNKERLSGEMLTNLIEHYSQHKLNLRSAHETSSRFLTSLFSPAGMVSFVV